MAADEAAASLNKVASYGQTTENLVVDEQASQRAAQKSKKAMEALQQRLAKQERDAKEKKERLSKVSVNDEDVKNLAFQFDLPKSEADVILRENGGDFYKAAEGLIS